MLSNLKVSKGLGNWLTSARAEYLITSSQQDALTIVAQATAISVIAI